MRPKGWRGERLRHREAALKGHRNTRRLIERYVGRKQGFKVIYRNKMYPGNYVGMNYFAAKELHIPFRHGRRTVVVWSGLSKRDRELTIRHEITEALAMEKLGMRYNPADKIAQGFENLEGVFR